jgi:cytidylate kinase
MKTIITISREYGSGGHTIGKLLSEKLNIPFYDKELIDMTAQESGLSPDFIKTNEQSISSAWLYNLMLGSCCTAPASTGVTSGISGRTNLPLVDQVFNAQRQVIINLAEKGPCVIVGRCSDYILRHSGTIPRDKLLNVFIYAPIEDKVKRAVEQKGLDPATAEKEIRQIDKRRANHYNTFTERTWGNREHYDLLINSSLLGLERTADMLAKIVRES